MELEPNNQRRMLFARIGASVIVFTLFVVLAVSWVLTQDSTLKWALLIPLVLSVLILPRRIVVDDFSEERMTRLRRWVSYVRLAYFVLAAAVMVGLPELLY